MSWPRKSNTHAPGRSIEFCASLPEPALFKEVLTLKKFRAETPARPPRLPNRCGRAPSHPDGAILLSVNFEMGPLGVGPDSFRANR